MIKKLQNKGTGKIGYLYIANKDVNYQVLDENDCVLGVYDTLPRLIKEWEDYEEPKRGWYIDETSIYEDLCLSEETSEKLKAIGNYFGTKEEAEEAAEKLKALKRLKDKGFRFTGWTIDDGLRISICSNIDKEDIYDEDKRKIKPDLDLLFGGKK